MFRSFVFLLYINGLPNASKFDTTLFADDTLLMLADKNSILLQQKVNEQIKKNIDLWLRINKLSLNYAKTNFIVFHKQPRKKFLDDLDVYINNHKIERVSCFKNLELSADNTLNTHIQHLSSLLVGLSGLFYRLRKYPHMPTRVSIRT